MNKRRLSKIGLLTVSIGLAVYLILAIHNDRALDQSTKRNKELEEALQNKTASLEKALITLNDLRKDHKELEKAKSPPAPPQIEKELQKKLDASVAKIDTLEALLRKKTAELARAATKNNAASLKQQLSKAQARNTDLEARLHRKSVDLMSTSEQLKSLEILQAKLDKIVTEKREKERALNNKITELTATSVRPHVVKALQNSLDRATIKNTELRADLFENKNLLADATSEVMLLKKRLTAAKELAGTAHQLKKDSAETQEVVQQLRAALESANRELASKNAALSKLSEASKADKNTLQTLKSELAASLAQRTTLAIKAEEQETTAITALSQNEIQKKTITELQGQVTALQAESEQLKEENHQLVLTTTDTDNDGVNDADDLCPDTVAQQKVGEDGCEPDSDKDGLADSLDLCPNSAPDIDISPLGCQKLTRIILEGVTFEPSTADLTPNTMELLDRVAMILQRSPGLKFEVAGYTDSIGSEQRNLNLSSDRAHATAVYLINKGVNPELLTSRGYGMADPIADNGTDEGRAKNRRVELHPLNQ